MRHRHLLGPVGGVLWGSWTRDRLFNANQKTKVLVSSIGILSKYTKERLWEAKKTFDHKGFWRNHISILHLLVTLQTAL